VKAWTL